ncbi:GNAT family N-acetyltransferase [Streptomyces sp. NPDC001549]|uniref:GNAT family N-acetyltransferase n=1 Tax=Streptomyces sp. NPDC001549 TaxID=3364586 RepID=UPI0036B83947
MGAAAGADADVQRWFGWIPDSIVTPETAAHLLGIHDGNRAERLRAFPKAVRRELIQPVVLPGPTEGQGLLAVDPATGLVAGMSSLTPDDDGVIGIWLAPAFRGRGLGTELVAATARFGHEHLGLASVRAGTETSNHRCRGALSAAGFVPYDGPALHTLPEAGSSTPPGTGTRRPAPPAAPPSRRAPSAGRERGHPAGQEIAYHWLAQPVLMVLVDCSARFTVGGSEV